jgi:hypothetical protein
LLLWHEGGALPHQQSAAVREEAGDVSRAAGRGHWRRRALEKATGPFLRVGADRDRPLKDFAEPVGEIGRLYRLVDLDLTAAACELDVARPEDLKALITASKGLRELGLGTLLQEGGAVKRADWERVGATSLMQRAAREIEKGSPFRVTK